jgi:hypothetical protein
MLVALATIVVGLVVAWAGLAGPFRPLAVAFRRARTFLRRMTQRRPSAPAGLSGAPARRNAGRTEPSASPAKCGS